MRVGVILLGVVLYPLFLWGADPVVTFITEVGKPVEVHFSDGRIAQWQMGRSRPVHLSPKFKVSENTCNKKEGLPGTLLFGAQLHQFALFWTKHPDPQKIGKKMQVRAKGSTADFADLADFGFVANGTKLTMPKASAEVPPDYLESPDFSWLPGTDSTAPSSITFARWDIEAMSTNPETGQMENRTIGIASGVRFEKAGPNRIELKAMKHYSGNVFAFFIGDIWAIILRDGDGYCQISQKANLADVLVEAQQYFSEPVTYRPYVFGSDEYSGNAMPFFFKFYKEKPEVYDVQ